MKTTKTLFGNKAQEAIINGVNAIYEPVRRTFGPQGKNALLYRTFNRGSRITNDGKTVADVQEPKDVFVRLVANTFKEACNKTNEKVGDGTTGTAILGGKLMNEIYNEYYNQNSDFTFKKGKIGVMNLKRQILENADIVKEKIKEKANKIETLEQLEKIAIVSVENEKLGKIIAKMAWEVGVDGFIDVVEGYKGEIETEIIKGFRFPAKVSAKAFVNVPARYEMTAKDCPILVTNYALDNASEIAKSLADLQQTTSKIIIVAPSFSENVLLAMVSATKAGYTMFPVSVPSLRTEQFEDLCIYTGATFIDKNKGFTLKSIKPQHLGFLEKLTVKDTELREDAIATGGRGDLKTIKENANNLEMKSLIEERIETLKSQLIETKQDNFKKLLERRIASMGSAVGIIRVGDSTEASSLYWKLKIEDAVYACKSALKSGYVKGGGLCLKEIAEELGEDNILYSTLLEPYKQIQSSVDEGIEITENIIDPADAIYFAVEHATQIVANLATVDIITPEMEDPIHGEGEFAIAKAINEYVLSNKIHLGQIKENEVEMERDMLNGLTVDEYKLIEDK